MRQLTDEQAVVGRWPDAWRGKGGHVWRTESFSDADDGGPLGEDWQSARQHPSVVAWEWEQAKENARPILSIAGATELVDKVTDQAARIAALEAQVANLMAKVKGVK